MAAPKFYEYFFSTLCISLEPHRLTGTIILQLVYYYHYYYYYYYYYFVELVPARVTTVLHCPLSCMQACISSSCCPVSLIRVSMKVPVGRHLPLVPTAQGWKQLLLGVWHKDLPASAFLFVSYDLMIYSAVSLCGDDQQTDLIPEYNFNNMIVR